MHYLIKTGLQPVTRYVKQVPYFEGWGVGARSLGAKDAQTDRQTDRQTDFSFYGQF